MQQRTDSWSITCARVRPGLLLVGLSGGWAPAKVLTVRQPAVCVRANSTSPRWELRHGHWFDGYRSAAVQDIRWRLKQGEVVGGASSARRAPPP